MRALITGASSGIGREMAIQLSKMGYDLILAARNQSALVDLKQQLTTDVILFPADLSQEEACYKLHEMAQNTPVDILINNAGFGLYGAFKDTDLATELNLIDVNIRALHILTKLFLKDFVAADNGVIMNVSSIAAFLPGPMMSVYYASKAYVQRLTEAIHQELRLEKSCVRICALCPGPVRTGFNRRAGAGSTDSGLDSQAVAAYALKKMFRGKLIIIPGWYMRVLHKAIHLTGTRLRLRAIAMVQKIRRGGL